ncbi:IclR family transcriptional regulator [Nocardioides sambongensis]|uniref:IclR family transcriptional regulator n=1 Tax=Nocardioides sambongensis TaxID=2589074 RepID=UPI001129BD63|nr:IclR family transcriptional regulator [Nocardioides sambongensis]
MSSSTSRTSSGSKSGSSKAGGREAGSGDAPVSMVARIAVIMRVFDEPGARFRLDEVAVRTGLPRSTVHRILDQLLATGWIQRRADGYSLSAGASTTRHSLVEHPELRAVAAPVLNRLHLDTGLAVHLGVLLGTEVLVLDRVVGRSTTGLPTRVGGRIPAHATALGKAILAHQSAEDVEALYRIGISKRTPRTIGDVGTLHQECSGIRSRRGLAFENEEFVLGCSALGAAVFGSDGVVGAISIGGFVPMEKIERLGPLVVRAAAHISQRLAGVRNTTEVARPVTDGVLGRVMQTLPADGWI